jgi:hypothetical protein
MPRCLLWKRVPGYTIPMVPMHLAPMAPMNLVEQTRALQCHGRAAAEAAGAAQLWSSFGASATYAYRCTSGPLCGGTQVQARPRSRATELPSVPVDL